MLFKHVSVRTLWTYDVESLGLS